MQNDTAIQVNHVSKLFYKQEQRTIKEMIPAFLTGKKTSNMFWALSDVHFSIKKGESIGIIGPNGSGKSTLLKLIAGVTKPTKGTINVEGRIAPLIELGAGFHPELTGRENVFLNGVILGMKRTEIETKFNDIVDFAELWEFIDQPIKHYSSGMYLRLAFAVAVHTEPDVFLVDEILAVGDQRFQDKCYTFIEELLHRNASLIIVSHDQHLLHRFCPQTIILINGKVEFKGETHSVLTQYNKHLGINNNE